MANVTSLTEEQVSTSTGINTHIGRDIHSTVNPHDFITFLEEFKGEK